MASRIETLEGRTLFATFLVTNTHDSGEGSLREAILDANASPGADNINFNIAGSGVHTIKPATPLPDITRTVNIDGYTQPGATKNNQTQGNNAKLLVQLDGRAA